MPYIVTRAEYVALNKAIGAMQYALQRIASGELSRDMMIRQAKSTLKLVEKYEREEKEK
jgi:ketol-acid reductoisomerase